MENLMTDYRDRYASQAPAPSGWSHSKKKNKILRQKFREKRAKEFVRSLRKQDRDDLRTAFTILDEGLSDADVELMVEVGADLNLYEYIQEKSKQFTKWIDKTLRQ
jgi:hypothetical protein